MDTNTALDSADVWICAILCALLSGPLILAGHKFFVYGQTCQGFAIGSVFFAIFVAAFDLEISRTLFLLLSVCCAILGGVTVVAIWYSVGSLFLHIFLSCALSGFVGDALTSHFIFDCWSILEGKWTNHMLVSFCTIFAIITLLFYWSRLANILGCTLLGASVVVVSGSIILNGHLHSILQESVVRFATPNHYISTLNCTTHIADFSGVDVGLSVLFGVLIVAGILCQYTVLKAKPPLPVSPPTIEWGSLYRTIPSRSDHRGEVELPVDVTITEPAHQLEAARNSGGSDFERIEEESRNPATSDIEENIDNSDTRQLLHEN